MEHFGEILLEVWREACRHIEIQESATRIAALLAAHMPLGRLCVRRVDWERSFVETVAWGLEPQTLPDGARSACSPGQREALRSWFLRREVWSPSEGPPAADLAAVLTPLGSGAGALVGPLTDGSHHEGVLVLEAAEGRRFGLRERRVAEVLLEPFFVALDNDRRVREMAALKEAAEAESRSLLTRLGRSERGDEVVGSEAGLKLVMERIDLVARSDVPVLILGETGTGKELAARALHTRSPRASGPFLRVNCGAIPPELVDSDLFGHERGAFTGAAGTRQGWFERADNGTLLLDEVGELPLAAQVRLLRVLQDGWFERVGGHRPLHVDVRIVAATHRDLAAMVADGRFRADLWYRIAVFPLPLPPLRERRGDIPALARHFAERAARRFHLPVAHPSEGDVDLLCAYPWPGNVRELAAVIDRAAILGNGRSLEVAAAMGSGSPPPATPSTAGDFAPSGARTALPSLAEATRRHVEAALTACAGRIEGPRGAAIVLDVNPHTLRSKMRKLGIEWGRFRRV